jgi:hypothetical protein
MFLRIPYCLLPAAKWQQDILGWQQARVFLPGKNRITAAATTMR